MVKETERMEILKKIKKAIDENFCVVLTLFCDVSQCVFPEKIEGSHLFSRRFDYSRSFNHRISDITSIKKVEISEI